MPIYCQGCGDDQADIHWEGKCHSCALHSPRYAEFLERELQRLTDQLAALRSKQNVEAP